jgi:hypothetical protein
MNEHEPAPLMIKGNLSSLKWVLFIFALPFAGAGFFSIRQSLREMTSARPMLIAVLLPWAAGVMFLIAAFAFLVIIYFGKEVLPGTESPLAIRKRLMGMKTPAEEWQNGRITTSGTGAVIGGWAKSLLSILLLGPVIGLGILRAGVRHEASYGFWCAAGVIPLGLIVQAIYRTLRWKKYGTSVLTVEHRPTASNGQFAFTIQPGQGALPAGQAEINIRCEKRTMTGSGDHRRLHVDVLWKETRTTPIQVEGLALRDAFTLPTNLPAASHSFSEGIFWILEVQSSTPGIDYYAKFDLELAW